MEFLEVELFGDDIFKLMVRFSYNLLFVGIIVWGYYRHQRRKPYVFTFLMINVMVFFICFTLKKLDLGLGMALGLFAIFAILRYRTDAMRVREMTYLFIVIGLAVINSLSNKQTSWIELGFVNFSIIVITFGLEQLLAPAVRLHKQNITYDRLELLPPDRRQELFDDLRTRTGLKPVDVQIGRIDLSKGSANIVLQYADDSRFARSD